MGIADPDPLDLEALVEKMRELNRPAEVTLESVVGADVTLRALELAAQDAAERRDSILPEDVPPILGAGMVRSEWVPPGKLILKWADGSMTTLDLTGEEE